MTVCLDIPSLAVGWAGPDPGTDLSRRPSNGPRSFKSCSTDDMLYCDKVLRGAMLLCTGRRWRSKKSVEVAPLRIRHLYGRTVSNIFPYSSHFCPSHMYTLSPSSSYRTLHLLNVFWFNNIMLSFKSWVFQSLREEFVYYGILT